VSKYIKKVGGDVGIVGAEKLKTKDLRGAMATSVVIRMRDEIKDQLFGPGGQPRTQADFDRFIDALSVEAARMLKNTPEVCRKHYINWTRVLDGQISEGFEMPLMESLD